METWLLLTACRKSLAPYPIVSSPTPTTYRLATIHPWWRDRQTDDTSCQRRLWRARQKTSLSAAAVSWKCFK